MALYLSASTAVVGQAVAQSNDFTVHALRRDSDGMLHYTKARSTEDAVFDFHRTDGESYTDFLQGTEYVEQVGNKALSNDPDDKYQQFRTAHPLRLLLAPPRASGFQKILSR